jgi:hypothetical protein
MILLHQWPLNQVDSGQQKNRHEVRGHTNRGTTSDQNVINSGMAKNKIDIQYPQSKNNTYESRAFTATENELWKKGKLNNSDNPIGRDTIGRAMQQKDNACFYELPVESPDLINTRKAGGTMMASKSSDVVAVI